MLRKIMLCYFVAVIITICIITVELGLRSAIISPFLLIESNKEDKELHKVLTGYSSIQGNYLLSIEPRELNENKDDNLGFDVINKKYTFQDFNNVDVMVNGDIEVVTRKGIIPSFSKETIVKESNNNILFNSYIISSTDYQQEITQMKIDLEYSDKVSIALYIISFLFSAAITSILNYRKSRRNLFTLFFPFILSVIVPIGMNYMYSFNYFLIQTDSYIYSFLLSILLPTWISLFLTSAILNLFSEQDNTNKSESTGFLNLNKREGIALFFVITSGLFYFLGYYLIPLSWHVKIIGNIYIYIIYYLSMLFLFMVGYLLLDRFIGKFEEINSSSAFRNIITSIEQKTYSKLRVFKKQDSMDEINAWVYTTNPFISNKVNVYVTEGLLSNFNKEEIKGILFHEIGHIKLKHNKFIIMVIFLIALIMSVVLFYSRILMLSYGWWHYILLFPLGIVILIFLIEWLPNYVSKLFEFQADSYAVKHSENKQLYVDTLLKLSKINDDIGGVEIQKRREWKESHPSFEKRIHNVKELIKNKEFLSK